MNNPNVLVRVFVRPPELLEPHLSAIQRECRFFRAAPGEVEFIPLADRLAEASDAVAELARSVASAGGEILGGITPLQPLA